MHYILIACYVDLKQQLMQKELFFPLTFSAHLYEYFAVNF